MANGKVRGIVKAKELLSAALSSAISSVKVLNDIGKFSVQRIQGFTRSGKYIKTGRDLKPLAQSTIENRRRTQRRGEHDSEYFMSPEFSNLTETGQLLRSLDYKVNETKSQIEITADGRRRDGKDNSDVAKWVKEQGRPFIGMDRVGRERIKKIILDEVKRALRKSSLK